MVGARVWNPVFGIEFKVLEVKESRNARPLEKDDDPKHLYNVGNTCTSHNRFS